MEFILDFPAQLSLKGDEYIILRPNMSEEEFWKITNEDTNFELIDGVLVIHSPASTEHESIFMYLTQILGFYLANADIGKIFGSRLVMHISAKWNPEPDIMILLKEHYDRITPTKIEGVADIVIEILSDATRDIDLTKKVPHYLQSGVAEIWIIDPQSKEVTIIQENFQQKYPLELSDAWIKSKVLPQLKFNVKWLWNREKYPINEIIKDFLKKKN